MSQALVHRNYRARFHPCRRVILPPVDQQLGRQWRLRVGLAHNRLCNPLDNHLQRPAVALRICRARCHRHRQVALRRKYQRKGRPRGQRLVQRQYHQVCLPMCPRHLLVKCRQCIQVARQVRDHLIIPACCHRPSPVICPRLPRRLHLPAIPHRIRQVVRRRLRHLCRASSLLRSQRIFPQLSPAMIPRRLHPPNRVMCRRTLPVRSRRRYRVSFLQMSRPVHRIRCLRAVQVTFLPVLPQKFLRASQVQGQVLYRVLLQALCLRSVLRMDPP